MHKSTNWLFIAGFFGFTGIALGAFGSHVFSDKLKYVRHIQNRSVLPLNPHYSDSCNCNFSR